VLFVSGETEEELLERAAEYAVDDYGIMTRE
jgi:hypothetical protein